MKDMPKLESPFIREEIDGHYKLTNIVDSDYEWVFSDKSIAVSKLDGTNVSIVVKNGEIESIYNRMTKIDIWSTKGKRIFDGLYNAIKRNYFDLKNSPDGQYFGELIGDKIQANPYRLDGHLWIPFQYLIKRYRYRFWDNMKLELIDLSNYDRYKKMSDLFKGLWCPFKRQHGILLEEINENTGFSQSCAAEGIIFYHEDYISDYSKCCKLRRDMFDWYKYRRHNQG